METYRILVTNDDGPKSPLLIPFLQALRAQAWCSELHAVFPAEEQSWISQAVSRFKPVFVEAVSFGVFPGYLVSGTPADCVGLGLHHLYATVSDYVFSGINLGTNATLPFYLNSGTLETKVDPLGNPPSSKSSSARFSEDKSSISGSGFPL